MTRRAQGTAATERSFLVLMLEYFARYCFKRNKISFPSAQDVRDDDQAIIYQSNGPKPAGPVRQECLACPAVEDPGTEELRTVTMTVLRVVNITAILEALQMVGAIT